MFYAVTVKKGLETKVPSTIIDLYPSLQTAAFNVVSHTPTHGPWEQVTKLLHQCDAAFNESAAAIKQAGMSAK